VTARSGGGAFVLRWIARATAITVGLGLAGLAALAFLTLLFGGGWENLIRGFLQRMAYLLGYVVPAIGIWSLVARYAPPLERSGPGLFAAACLVLVGFWLFLMALDTFRVVSHHYSSTLGGAMAGGLDLLFDNVVVFLAFWLPRVWGRTLRPGIFLSEGNAGIDESGDGDG